MVSRRNFASITVVMAVIFFLFQFLNLAKSHWNDYKVNQYAQSTDEMPGADSVFYAQEGVTESVVLNEESKEESNEDTSLISWSELKTVACIGSSQSDGLGTMLKDWCLYMKRSVSYYDSFDAYENATYQNDETPQFILIDPDFIDWEDAAQIRGLQNCVKGGVSLIFGRLPDVSVIEAHKSLQQLLGIDEIKKNQVTVQGIHLYKGLLLGGEVIYKAKNEEEEKKQDLNLTFPWYHLTSGTKVYMKGMLEDESIDVQEYPVLIWRKNFDTASVFAVNGDYMSGASGLGLLTGMLCDMQSYTIYPIINAQNFVAANYPGFANENTTALQKMYSQTMRGVLRDVIWPTFSSINIETSFRLTSMMAMQFDYTDAESASQEDVSYYMEAVNEEEGEMGYSSVCVSDTSLEEKLSVDETFWNEVLPEYEFSSVYAGNRSDMEMVAALDQSFFRSVRTVVQQEDDSSDIVGFLTDHVTRQKTLIDGYEHTYSQDLKIRSIETALGYTSILADISCVAYPQSEEDGWEKLSEKLMANTITYWEPFACFEGTTVSECDSRIRRFLSLSYQTAQKENKLLLTVSQGSETAWFLLRTNGQVVAEISGGSAQKVEDDVWLIGIDSRNAMITFEPEHQAFYYE